MSSVWFRGFPMSPSENNMYPTVFSRHKKRFIRVPSADLRQFKKDAELWRLQNLGLVNQTRPILKRTLATSEDALIRVDAYLCFPRDQVYTLKHKRKKMDASNRLKALHDALAEILQIDDRYFSTGISEPVAMTQLETPCIQVNLSLSAMKTYSQVLEEMNGPW